MEIISLLIYISTYSTHILRMRTKRQSGAIVENNDDDGDDEEYGISE